MSDYLPQIPPLALEASPFLASDTNGANVTHGSDAASTAPAPAVPRGFTVSDFVAGVLSNVPILSDVARTGASATGKQISTEQGKKDLSVLVWSVLLVVIGLMLLSRGFGIIGEEGEGVIVNLSNPSKYPGIGHAIQGMKGSKK